MIIIMVRIIMVTVIQMIMIKIVKNSNNNGQDKVMIMAIILQTMKNNNLNF